MEDEVSPGPLDAECLVKVDRPFRIERREVAIRPIRMVGDRAARRSFRFSQDRVRKIGRDCELGSDIVQSARQQTFAIDQTLHRQSFRIERCCNF